MFALYSIFGLLVVRQIFLMSIDMYLRVKLSRLIHRASRYQTFFELAGLEFDAKEAISCWQKASEIAFLLRKETLADWCWEKSTKVVTVRDYELERIERLIK
jgi:hypothetical protein